MREENQLEILVRTGAQSIEKIEVIQSLWSGYGKILRIHLKGANIPSVILKNSVQPVLSNHPRGWNTEISNARKIKSYEVETNWYVEYSSVCDEHCRIPKFIHFWEDEGERFILLEDLDAAGFPKRKSNLSIEEINECLKWLANFHATFLNVQPTNLWEIGTYWHLETRPDEFNQMADGPLKRAAHTLNEQLNNCQFSTLVHGDAKVANFCFGASPEAVAALDFQYVGGGCGMKDVAYFLGSVLNESRLEPFNDSLLDTYFSFLKSAVELKSIGVNFEALEEEWRRLYPIAWADFTRFLLGWMPTHQKLNGFSEKMVRMALMDS